MSKSVFFLHVAHNVIMRLISRFDLIFHTSWLHLHLSLMPSNMLMIRMFGNAGAKGVLKRYEKERLSVLEFTVKS